MGEKPVALSNKPHANVADNLLTPDELFAKHQGWAEALANRYVRDRGLHTHTADEAKNSALIGLWEATERWQPDGAQFRTFAFRRINGAMLSTSRAAYTGGRRNIPPRLVSLEGLAADDGQRADLPDTSAPDPLGVLLEAEAARGGDTFQSLPAEHRPVLRLLYIEGWLMAEVGRLYGVSEARISQMHKLALVSVRSRLEGESSARSA